jgi:hypothetical protein
MGVIAPPNRFSSVCVQILFAATWETGRRAGHAGPLSKRRLPNADPAFGRAPPPKTLVDLRPKARATVCSSLSIIDAAPRFVGQVLRLSRGHFRLRARVHLAWHLVAQAPEASFAVTNRDVQSDALTW